MAFDEGGVGIRSRHCPVRQFNKDKPQKFRVDFFIMASSANYAILHLHVYQGKNATNSNIRPSIHKFSTTMKAVLNACYALGLHKETEGMHHISMDNRYMAPQLAVILRKRFNCFWTGTVRSNRVGWDKTLMNLSKSKTNRGTFKVIHDAVNGVVCGQWVDSKVVSFVSTIEDTGHSVVQRQIGSKKKELNCPNPLICYQKAMGSVDKGDQMRGHFGGGGGVLETESLQKVVQESISCLH